MRALLNPIDITGAPVTADAAHAWAITIGRELIGADPAHRHGTAQTIGRHPARASPLIT